MGSEFRNLGAVDRLRVTCVTQCKRTMNKKRLSDFGQEVSVHSAGKMLAMPMICRPTWFLAKLNRAAVPNS